MTTKKQRRVLRAAYEWRYALVTPGSDLDVVRRELINAVDDLDTAQSFFDADEESIRRRTDGIRRPSPPEV